MCVEEGSFKRRSKHQDRETNWLRRTSEAVKCKCLIVVLKLRLYVICFPSIKFQMDIIIGAKVLSAEIIRVCAACSQWLQLLCGVSGSSDPRLRC